MMDGSESAGALRSHRFLVRAALGASHVFAWIFIFQYFAYAGGSIAGAVARAALLYALAHLIVALATPPFARLLRRGVRRMILYALFSAAFALLALAAGVTGVIGGSAAVIAFAILLGTYRAAYYVPYEVERDIAPPPRSRISEIAIALMPLFAGIVIAASLSGPVMLLALAAAAIALSAFPLLDLRDAHENFSWGYRQTYGEMLLPEHRALVVHAFLEGISGAALLFLWPLAVFMLFGWSYALLGLVVSLTLIAGLFLRPLVRRLIRRAGLHASRPVSLLLILSPWIARLAVASPLGIVLVDSYFYSTSPVRYGVDPFTYEQASDGGTFVDEYTALKEIALSLGRVALAIIAAIVALSYSPAAAFVVSFALAALASLAALRVR